MALLSKKKQVVIATERIAGTEYSSGLTTAANADILVDSAEPSFEIDYIDREFLRDTLTKIKSIPGQKTGGISIGVELTGNAGDIPPIDLTDSTGLAPSWSRLMEYSGFRTVILDKVEIASTFATGAGLGAIRHGEAITGSGAGLAGSGVVVGDVHEGDKYIFYVRDGTTAIAGATVTMGDTGVIATTVAFTPLCGWGWHPVSEATKTFVVTASLSFVKGDVYKGNTNDAVVVVAVTETTANPVFRAISGTIGAGEGFTQVTGTGVGSFTTHATQAEQFVDWPTASFRLNEDGVASDFLGSRCNVAFEFEVNRPVKLNFTSRGRWDTSADVAQLSSTATLIDPKLWAGGVTTITPNEGLEDDMFGDDVTACFKTVSIDMGITLADVKCGHADDGLLEIVGSERSASGSFTVNATAEAQVPWLGAFRSGEVNRLRFQIGGDADFEDGFLLQVPSAQTTGASTGDEDGIMTRQIDFSLNAGVIDNLNAGTPDGLAYSTRGDNELILFYITA